MTQREIENQKKTKQEDLVWGQAEDEEGIVLFVFMESLGRTSTCRGRGDSVGGNKPNKTGWKLLMY